jgi:uncharacterized protein
MPTVSQIIKTAVRQTGVRQDIVEKDYALSYLLAALLQVPELGHNLVLKGGTALRKLYFPGYRFSEDLDFSTRLLGPIPGLPLLMQTVIHHLARLLDDRGPFQLRLEPLLLPQPHPTDQGAYLVRVQFPEMRRPLCRLKIEITIDEPVLQPVALRPLDHAFPEEFPLTVPAYTLLEITAEKLRALLQSQSRLQARGWGASRVCRDYYDLWRLLPQPAILASDLLPLLRQKCALRQVHFTSPADFIPPALLAVARQEWQAQLLPFVPTAPPVERCLDEVTTLLQSLFD